MVLWMEALAGEYHELGERRYCLISMARGMDGLRRPHNSVSSFGLTILR